MDIKKHIVISLLLLVSSVAEAVRFELKPGQEIYGQLKYTVYDNSNGIFEFTRKHDVAHMFFWRQIQPLTII